MRTQFVLLVVFIAAVILYIAIQMGKVEGRIFSTS